jgi:hypothetical protein
MSTIAMKGGIGVADVALLDVQAEISRMHKIRKEVRGIRWFTGIIRGMVLASSSRWNGCESTMSAW